MTGESHKYAALWAERNELRAEVEWLRHDWAVTCKTLGEVRADIQRLHALLDGDAVEIMRLIRELERLHALLRDLRPDIERLEICEASSEDGNTPRLQMLRRALGLKP